MYWLVDGLWYIIDDGILIVWAIGVLMVEGSEEEVVGIEVGIIFDGSVGCCLYYNGIFE